jgi:hypothetical protein
MWRAVGLLAITPNDIERLMRLIARIALLQRAASTTARSAGRRFLIGWRRLAVAACTAARAAGFIVLKGFGAVVREPLARAAVAG